MKNRIRTMCRTMPDLREAVLKRLDELEWTRYDLVQALKGKRTGGRNVPDATVYGFLREGTPINSVDLGLIFDALKLDVTGRK